MSDDERLERILTAAYACFTRHGVRRTTMEDIAREAGMSRPAVYQYVRNKEDAFRRLTERMLDGALAEARSAAQASVGPTERLAGVLQAKLGLALTLWRDSPAHAAELLGADSRLSATLIDAYTDSMRELLVQAAGDLLPKKDAAEFADLLLALARGLETDLAHPDIAIDRLHRGVTLLVAGLTSGIKQSPVPKAKNTKNAKPENRTQAKTPTLQETS
jgi:AcrR family transcriptional regulator